MSQCFIWKMTEKNLLVISLLQNSEFRKQPLYLSLNETKIGSPPVLPVWWEILLWSPLNISRVTLQSSASCGPGNWRKVLWSSVHHDCNWEVQLSKLVGLFEINVQQGPEALALGGESSWHPLSILSWVLSHSDSAWWRDSHPFLPRLKTAYQSQDRFSTSRADITGHSGNSMCGDFQPRPQSHGIQIKHTNKL